MKQKSALMTRVYLECPSDPATALLKRFKLCGFLKMNYKAHFDPAPACVQLHLLSLPPHQLSSFL